MRVPRLHRPAKYYFGNYGQFPLGLARARSGRVATVAATFTARKSTAMKKKEKRKENNDTERSPRTKTRHEERTNTGEISERLQIALQLKSQRCARKNGNGHRFLFVGVDIEIQVELMANPS